MSRLVLIHWNAAEAGERAKRLREAGHTVEIHSDPRDSAGLRRFRDSPPEAFIIDLSRLPSHGSAVAAWIRQQKATRPVPIVLVEGAAEKVENIRGRLPDACYSSWGGIRSALAAAIANPPAEPVVPGTMDSYSGTPLLKKLGVKAGSTVVLLSAPKGFEAKLEPLPAGVRIRKQARGPAPVVLLFARTAANLTNRFPEAASAVAGGGRLWICWPKKASGAGADLTQAAVREQGLNAGWVDFKICAVDETWSGLAFSRRQPAKPR